MAKTADQKLRAEWDLSLLYKSPNDPQIDKDIDFAEKAYVVFSKKYKNKTDYLHDEDKLLKALKDYEAILDIPASKPAFYLHLAQDKNSKDETVRAKANLVSQRLQKISNLTVFFEINLSKIPKGLQKKFLTSKKLLHFNFFLKRIFKNSKFLLTEPEEKILSLKSLTSRSLWVQALRKIKSKQTIEHRGKEIPMPEAESIIKDIPTQKERAELSNKIMEKYYSLADIAESEINAVVTDKKIDDELRGFKEAYDGTILGYENDEKTVLSLVKTVTDNFHLSQKFYTIKAKMLGLKKLYYADRVAFVGKNNKKVTFEESKEILSKLFTSVDPKFGEILEKFVSNGQIDAFPKVGKTGGAYCSSDHGQPTFVLLNHTDSLDSLSTFAHEMGHAIHSEFSKTQPVLYEGYSTATAEVASTLFEYFLFYDQFEKLSEKEKIIALHDKIQDDIATVFRQIACFNFELEMHNTIRKNGNVSHGELAKMMNKHMKSYIGGVVELQEKDGYFFVGWPHIRNFFYVYTYAFGQLTSKVLYQKYKEDKSYIEKIKKFLSAGGSLSPEDIFKSIGLDLRNPEFWKEGIKSIEEDIKLLDKLVSKK
ncbi:MAG: M3 family oligoendopeptidase [Parcubacteria group bacterium]